MIKNSSNGVGKYRQTCLLWSSSSISPFFSGIWLCSIISACLLLIGLSTSVHAQATAGGNGRISGRLLNGSQNKAPLAGQSITLQAAEDGSARDLATTVTAGDGAFSFSNLDTNKAITYAVYVRYRGAQYVSTLLTLDTRPTQQIDLLAYDATSNPSRIAILQATVLMREPDAKKGTITVSEVFAFRNLDTHSFVGSLDASNGKPKALFFSLPHDARNVALTKGFEGYKVAQIDRGFATDAALLPGSNEFSFAFDVPYTAATYNFSYVAMYPTVQLSLLTPVNIRTSSGAMTPQGETTSGNHQYRLFKADGLTTNQEMNVNLEGLPLPVSASAPAPIDTGFVWLIVGLIIMVAIIFVTAFVGRFGARLRGRKHGSGSYGRSVSSSSSSNKRRRSDDDRDDRDEHPHREERERKGDRDEQRHKEDRERRDNRDERHHKEEKERREAKNELLHDLRELDKAYENGKVGKTAYQERRARLKARLRNVMSEEEDARR